jgi:hypothetical protein
MSSSSDVYMLTHKGFSEEEVVIALKASLKKVCENGSKYWAKDGYKLSCIQVPMFLDNATCLGDIVAISRGTLSLVNNILFCRSSAYACASVPDHHAEIFNDAIIQSKCFIQHWITEIKY